MEKRYQVFVSSTFADLKDERARVYQTLMEMDCTPAGMELFPAVDEEQFKFIKKVIDDCDYYLLIIGGRYGSVAPDGIGYTEKEFDYAVSSGIKVVALIHSEPENIPLGKSETDPRLREMLDQFKAKVATGRLIKHWTNASELPGLVALSLNKTIKAHPATGWIRGNAVTNEVAISELARLKAENSKIRALNENLVEQAEATTQLADFDSSIKLHVTFDRDFGSAKRKRSIEAEVSWRKLFGSIAPHLLDHPTDYAVRIKLAQILARQADPNSHSANVDEEEFKTLGVQLQAYGLVKVEYLQTVKGGMGLFWSLTAAGTKIMFQERTVKK